MVGATTAPGTDHRRPDDRRPDGNADGTDAVGVPEAAADAQDSRPSKEALKLEDGQTQGGPSEQTSHSVGPRIGALLEANPPPRKQLKQPRVLETLPAVAAPAPSPASRGHGSGKKAIPIRKCPEFVFGFLSKSLEFIYCM